MNIARAMCKVIGGELECVSALGKGTTITLKLRAMVFEEYTAPSPDSRRGPRRTPVTLAVAAPVQGMAGPRCCVCEPRVVKAALLLLHAPQRPNAAGWQLHEYCKREARRSRRAFSPSTLS